MDNFTKELQYFVSDKLKQYMKINKITFAECANKLGVSDRTISNLVNKKNACDIKTLVKLYNVEIIAWDDLNNLINNLNNILRFEPKSNNIKKRKVIQ